MNRLIYILLIFIFPFATQAQDEINIATKEFSESFKYKKNFTIELNGERADVNVQGENIDEIQIKARVISKNSSKSLAKSDLESMNVILEKIGKTVYARNYISVKVSDEKPSSNLKVVFDIKVPMSCNVVINNAFGEIQLNNLNGVINLNTRYTKINMAYLGGQGKVESLLGDVNIHSSFGAYNFLLNRADLLLENSDGYFDIESKYGAIEATIKPELEMMKIKGVSVDIVLIVDDISASYYNLVSTNGKIQIDKNLKLDYKFNESDEVQKIEINKGVDCSKLNIDTQYGTITLNKTSI